MSKILCEFDGHRIMCKVTENMGYQDGCYVKAVEYNGEERIVTNERGIWAPRNFIDKILISRPIIGQ